jgi:hypothetical protein
MTVNVTLIISAERYAAVIAQWVRRLESVVTERARPAESARSPCSSSRVWTPNLVKRLARIDSDDAMLLKARSIANPPMACSGGG